MRTLLALAASALASASSSCIQKEARYVWDDRLWSVISRPSGVPSAEDCRRRCQANQHCEIWSWQRNSRKYCYLMRDPGHTPFKWDGNYFAGPRDCEQGCEENDVAFEGYVIGQDHAYDALDCRFKCKHETRCFHWTYDHGRCLFHSKVGARVSRPGAVAGPRSCDGSIDQSNCLKPGAAQIGGHSYSRSLTPTNPEQCRTHCQDTDGCTTWLFSTDRNYRYKGCWMMRGHRGIDARYDASKWTLGESYCKSSGCLDGHTSTGRALQTTTATSLADCQLRCAGEDGCEAFTFQYSSKECVLRAEVGSLQPARRHQTCAMDAESGLHTSRTLFFRGRAPSSRAGNKLIYIDSFSDSGVVAQYDNELSPKTCAAKCEQHADCRFWRLNQYFRFCKLQNFRDYKKHFGEVVGERDGTLNTEAARDCFRHDVRHMSPWMTELPNVATVEECWAACRDADWCSGFNYRVPTSSCYGTADLSYGMKAERGTISGFTACVPSGDVDYCTSGELNWNAGKPSCPATTTTTTTATLAVDSTQCLAHDTRITGQPLMAIGARDVGACFTACVSHEDCAFFAFSSASGLNCSLLRGPVSAVRAEGVVSGSVSCLGDCPRHRIRWGAQGPLCEAPSTTTTTTTTTGTIDDAICFAGGLDYFGNDIRGIRDSPSPAHCLDECRKQRGCLFYSWNPAYNTKCWLKSSAGGSRYNADSVSGSVRCDASALVTTPRPTTTTTTTSTGTINNALCFAVGLDYFGNDIRGIRNSPSADHCLNECRKQSGCRFYSWNPTYNTKCWLKSSAAGARYSAAAISGAISCTVQSRTIF